MTALAVLDESRVEQVDDAESVHVYCCDPNRTLCGMDATDCTEVTIFSLDEVCVVCLNLEFCQPERGTSCSSGGKR